MLKNLVQDYLIKGDYALTSVQKDIRDLKYIGKSLSICGYISDVFSHTSLIFSNKRETTIHNDDRYEYSPTYVDQTYILDIWLELTKNINFDISTLNKGTLIECTGLIDKLEPFTILLREKKLTISLTASHFKIIQTDWLTHEMMGIQSDIYM